MTYGAAVTAAGGTAVAGTGSTAAVTLQGGGWWSGWVWVVGNGKCVFRESWLLEWWWRRKGEGVDSRVLYMEACATCADSHDQWRRCTPKALGLPRSHSHSRLADPGIA